MGAPVIQILSSHAASELSLVQQRELRCLELGLGVGEISASG